jgi:hypothetical protein
LAWEKFVLNQPYTLYFMCLTYRQSAFNDGVVKESYDLQIEPSYLKMQKGELYTNCTHFI